MQILSYLQHAASRLFLGFGFLPRHLQMFNKIGSQAFSFRQKKNVKTEG
jgi:hypothetical protein